MAKNIIRTARIDVSQLEYIKKFIGSDSNPKFFITMTEVNKIGINPRFRFHTPLGVYCYPLTEDIYDQLISNKLPYANDKPYINLFTISQPLFNLGEYGERDFNKDKSIIKKMYSVSEDDVNLEIEAEHVNRFWKLTRKVSKSISLKWNKVFRDLGYVGFYDPGMGVIHSQINKQAVIFDSSIIIPIESFLNPFSGNEGISLIQEDKDIIKRKHFISDIPALSEAELNKIVDGANNPLTLVKVTKNPAITETILDKIIDKTNNSNILEEVAKSSAATENILNKIVDKTNNSSAIIEVARNPAVTEVVLSKIIDNINEEKDKYAIHTLMSIINSSGVTENIFNKIIEKTKNEQVFHLIVESPAVTADILDKIIDKSNLPSIIDLSMMVVKSPMVTQDILNKIVDRANDESISMFGESLFQAVAESPLVTEAILDKIASKTNDPYILEIIVKAKDNLKAASNLEKSSKGLVIDLIYKKASIFEMTSLKIKLNGEIC